MSMNESTAPRLVVPALSGLYEALAPYSYAFMRFCVGAILVPHGYAKLFHGAVNNVATMVGGWGLQPAMAWAYWIGILEFVGGVMIAVGFLTRPIAFMVAFEMAVAMFMVHWGNGYFWTSRGFEYPMMWGLLCLAIAIRGGERLSVDRALGREI